MAYDGIFIKAQIKEIKNIIINEHINRITQKSLKEISFHIRKNGTNYVFTMSANPNFPYMLLSDKQTENRDTPPAFCMLLRKYLQSGLIKDIKQIGRKFLRKFDENNYLERIVKIEIENINNNGDLMRYNLYFEIMGKYSNIILTDSDDMIIDMLIKGKIDNPRLVPKLKYSIKEIANKNEILFEDFDGFMSSINESNALSSINEEEFDIANGISKKYAGLSKQFIYNTIYEYLSTSRKYFKPESFNYKTINKYLSDKSSYEGFFTYLKSKVESLINANSYSPTINYKGNRPSDFYIYKLVTFEGDIKTFDSINESLDIYIAERYAEINDTSELKNLQTLVKNLYTNFTKKLDIYKKDLAKCKDIDMYKNYGDLVSTFGYNLEDIKDGILTCEDFNNNNEIVKIPVDESLTVAKNVERYYDKYNKLKRTKDNAEKLISEVNGKIEHLNSISNALDLPNDKNDLYLIREEIVKYFGEANKYQNLSKQKNDIKSRSNVFSKKNKLNYNIHHYKSSSGIDIYVGKNNLQNDYLTFTLADTNDTWMHIKNATGSHVIVKGSYENLDDKTLIEAASLAAYYSEKRNETKATVDYTLRKELKKVKGKSPGFCIYHKNYSINVKPEIIINEI